MEGKAMVYAERMGNVFEIDLHAPHLRAKAWAGDCWREHFLTNEEVLFNDGAHGVDQLVADGLRIFHRPTKAVA